MKARMGEKQYYVYIITNSTRTLYIGMTNSLERRVWEHKDKAIDGFSSKYNVRWLVWYAVTNDVREAIATEKRIKGWTRAKKIALIEAENPVWRDLTEGWYDDYAKATEDETS